ncbi:ComEC/Rec2 family competence protein [Bombella mellum]|uniref:Transporter n=1 Tax=Bombella mellum TaxID=2039288 RepID=A0ABR5ZQ62_9PROT|nr:ComEC/Rec2 family competence protein [Bombella mellum]MBA5726472.1 transporter [Bombella mellum]
MGRAIHFRGVWYGLYHKLRYLWNGGRTPGTMVGRGMVRMVVRVVAEGLARQGSRRTCWLPVGLALGIVGYFALPEEPSWGSCLLAGGLVGLGLVLLVWTRRMEAVTERAADWQMLGHCTGGGLLTVGLGFLLACGQARRQPPMPQLPLESVWVQGRLAVLEPLAAQHEGQATGWRVGIDGAVFESPWWEGMTPLRRRVMITFRPGAGRQEKLEELMVGQSVRLRALLRSPALPFWPGGRDGQRGAWFEGRAGAGLALSPPMPGERPYDGGLSDRLAVRLAGLRQGVARVIAGVLPGQEGAVASAVLCGETGRLSMETRRRYAASGLAHLLAVAGLHLGFVMGMAFAVMRRCLSLSQRLSAHWPCREVALTVSLGVGLGYVVLTGLHVPGLRALGLAGLGVMALLLGRRAVSMRGLALVCLALEVASPALVLDVSFQMSFAAVMVLIAGYESLRNRLARLGGHDGAQVDDGHGRRDRAAWRRGAVFLATLAMTSLLAGLATLPLSMAYFGAFQPWFVVANLLAVPLMGVWVMPAGMVALLMMPFGLSAVPLHVMGWGIGLIGWLAGHVAAAPLASLPVPSFPSWVVGLYMLGLTVTCLWRGRGRAAGVGLVLGAMVAVWSVDRPVMLLVAQGNVLAVRQGGAMKVVDGRPGSGPLLQEMRRAFGWQADTVGPPECREGVCRLRLKAGRVILWRGASGPDEVEGVSCRDVVLEVRMGPQHPLCPAVRQLGPAAVRQEGSWAVYEGGRKGVRLLSDRMVQGHRLWTDDGEYRTVSPFPLAREE